MNVRTRAGDSRKDAIFSLLALAILLIGTAVDSAIALFVMAVVALAVMTVVYRKQFGLGPVVGVTVVAIVGAAVVLVMARM